MSDVELLDLLSEEQGSHLYSALGSVFSKIKVHARS